MRNEAQTSAIGARAGRALPGLAAALALLIFGATAFQQSLAYTRAETELSFWGKPNYQPVERTIERTGATIDALVQHDPGHPDYRSLQAYQFSWRGFWSAEVDTRLKFNQLALESQYAALQARPAHRQGWAKMLEYASRTTGGEAMIDAAQARMQALQPGQK